jgi:hypothetical protein
MPSKWIKMLGVLVAIGGLNACLQSWERDHPQDPKSGIQAQLSSQHVSSQNPMSSEDKGTSSLLSSSSGSLSSGTSSSALSSLGVSSSAALSSSSEIAVSSSYLGRIVLNPMLLDTAGFGSSNGAGQRFLLSPDDEQLSNGTSYITDLNGKCIGTCKQASANWNMSTLLRTDYLAYRSHVTAWVKGSETGWGWAMAGIILWPKVLGNCAGLTHAECAQKNVFVTGDTLFLDLEYPLNDTLTLFAYGVTSENLGSDAPPRTIIKGSGARMTYKLPISQFQKPVWIQDPYRTFSVTNITGIGFHRLFGALYSGQAFPSGITPKDLKLYRVWID